MRGETTIKKPCQQRPWTHVMLLRPPNLYSAMLARMKTLHVLTLGRPKRMERGRQLPRQIRHWVDVIDYRTDGIRSKRSPVCAAEASQDCCLARRLSGQEDVRSQISMLEAAIACRGHLCIFLPKFRCELNPIEMRRDSNCCEDCFLK
ncbi:hypothetical protein CNE00345 [Cryptococcus deneoformans JEC21]|uniref:Uncharacterized protein n=1 Tax=Cryptococcus deneoformans (strain JEC21 / ATCC MYA-565) TaxID=214684 RepID=A0A0S2LIK0_CRYD1|nr:hypothetical protein CNE00345 [Cryptococcus neoformans var. neoformans JEC21]ALO60548.1 hypothetical protein CNE00345 [Cryptococcus neoformans var. neoformans JEC21]